VSINQQQRYVVFNTVDINRCTQRDERQREILLYNWCLELLLLSARFLNGPVSAFSFRFRDAERWWRISRCMRYDYLRREPSNPTFRIFSCLTLFSIFHNTFEILTFNLFFLWNINFNLLLRDIICETIFYQIFSHKFRNNSLVFWQIAWLSKKLFCKVWKEAKRERDASNQIINNSKYSWSSFWN